MAFGPYSEEDDGATRWNIYKAAKAKDLLVRTVQMYMQRLGECKCARVCAGNDKGDSKRPGRAD